MGEIVKDSKGSESNSFTFITLVTASLTQIVFLLLYVLFVFGLLSIWERGNLHLNTEFQLTLLVLFAGCSFILFPYCSGVILLVFLFLRALFVHIGDELAANILFCLQIPFFMLNVLRLSLSGMYLLLFNQKNFIMEYAFCSLSHGLASSGTLIKF